MHFRRTFLFGSALLLATSCGSTVENDSDRASVGSGSTDVNEGPVEPLPPIVPTPWTDRFLEKAVVVADTIRIEGPNGLLEHVIVSSDNEYFERQVKHTAGQLVQTTTRISDEVPEIRAQIDQWQLAAFRKIVVVERLEPCPVTLTATGEASYRDPLGKEERAETLRWTSEIGGS